LIGRPLHTREDEEEEEEEEDEEGRGDKSIKK